jgi:hypothetical protein
VSVQGKRMDVSITAAECEQIKQSGLFAELPLCTVLNPAPRNRSIRATRWQLMTGREKIREVCAIALVAGILGVIIFGVVLLATESGRDWLMGH